MLARVPAIDVPFLDLTDIATLAGETCRVAALGFTGKGAVHPAQVAAIHAASAPPAEEVARAERIVAAVRASQGSANVVDGRMVNAPC